jgi:addiction module HigA family antidote
MTDIPKHPGKLVALKCLKANGITVTEAAERLGVARNTLSRLLNGKNGISAEMAIRLSSVFTGEPETWMKAQMDYDLARARLAVSDKSTTPVSKTRKADLWRGGPENRIRRAQVPDDEYRSMNPEERIEMVWPLTMTALAFERKLDVQSRLSRDSVSLFRREGAVPVGWRVRSRGSR